MSQTATEEKDVAVGLVGMQMDPDIARSLANERLADMLRDADRSRLAREARGDHAGLVARMREQLSRVSSRERRVFRPARVG